MGALVRERQAEDSGWRGPTGALGRTLRPETRRGRVARTHLGLRRVSGSKEKAPQSDAV